MKAFHEVVTALRNLRNRSNEIAGCLTTKLVADDVMSRIILAEYDKAYEEANKALIAAGETP